MKRHNRREMGCVPIEAIKSTMACNADGGLTPFLPLPQPQINARTTRQKNKQKRKRERVCVCVWRTKDSSTSSGRAGKKVCQDHKIESVQYE